MSQRTVRRHSWPLDSEAAVDLLQADLPGWVVTFQPGRTGMYLAELIRTDGGYTALECPEAGQLYATIEMLFDEGPA